MSEQRSITVDELRNKRLMERISKIVAEYEAKLVEVGIEKDLITQQFNQEREQTHQDHQIEVNGLVERIQQLETEINNMTKKEEAPIGADEG
jgi:type I restriction-modification system DNA methylase subunit